jgi:transposase
MESIRKDPTRKNVTLRLLWMEYREKNPDGYQYRQFCERHHQWSDKLDVSLRQTHRVGGKLFVDYAGQTIPVTDLVSGQTRLGRCPAAREQRAHQVLSMEMRSFSCLDDRCPLGKFPLLLSLPR